MLRNIIQYGIVHFIFITAEVLFCSYTKNATFRNIELHVPITCPGYQIIKSAMLYHKFLLANATLIPYKQPN